MKSDSDKKIEITQARFAKFVEGENQLRKLQAEQDENAGAKKFLAFLLYCLTVWGVSLDEGGYAIFFAMLGPAFLFIFNSISKISDGEEFVKIWIALLFASAIAIGIFSMQLGSEGVSGMYFYVFVFSAMGAGFLPLKKSPPWKN